MGQRAAKRQESPDEAVIGLRGGRTFIVAVLAAVAALVLFLGLALALFTDTASVPGNTFTTDILAPPTGLTATGGSSITLNWTATADTYASGYHVYRSATAGGPYSRIGPDVTPRTNTTYTDSPGAGTYYYVVRAFYQNWESANSNEASATVSTTTDTGFRDCSANAAVTTGSGDNNGFQTNPANACGDGGGYAEDTNSGTNTDTPCNSTGKDRHLFYDYVFSIPAGSIINGIEVRLDAWIDGGSSPARRMCVELSWDGGSTWTVAQTTPTLTTSELNLILGSASDDWGRTWASTDFSVASFRVRITNVAPNTSRDFRLDWAPVQVTYTPP